LGNLDEKKATCLSLEISNGWKVVLGNEASDGILGDLVEQSVELNCVYRRIYAAHKIITKNKTIY